MKKKFLGKIIASIVAVLIGISGISVAVAEQKNSIDAGKADASISPFFMAITACENNLILNSGGRLTCEGKTEVQYGYIAGLTVELQQYDEQWNTIKTWNASDSTVVSLCQDWYVIRGYEYRLKLTHTAMDSDSTVIETSISYSETITYE